MAKKRQINGHDVYEIQCSSCEGSFEGRFAYPSFTGGDGRYCNQCSNLKIWIEYEESGPSHCECGGVFDSYDLICPSCSNVIHDAEKQLAAQFYVVEPSKIQGNPTQEEIDNWYSARTREGFLTGTELFVQLQRLLAGKEGSAGWKYYERFEI